MTCCPNCGHRIDEAPLPQLVTDSIREQFGPGSRTFAALGKRVRHALRVWGEKYELNDEQYAYAIGLLCRIITLASDVTDAGHKRARVYTALDSVVHHERTHAEMMQRANVTLDLDRELVACV